MKVFFGFLIGIIFLIGCYSCLHTVDFTEYVIVSRFGRHDRIYDGSIPLESGLHFKFPWPVETVKSVPRALFALEMPPAELLTRDPQKNTIDRTLTIDSFVVWRIPNSESAERFARRVGGVDEARQILTQRISSELGSIIGGMELKDLLDNEDNQRVPLQREKIRNRVLEKLHPFEDDFGIRTADFQVRRVGYPSAVRQAIYDRIVSEREKKAAEYLSQGEQEAAKIRSDGEKMASEIRSGAEAESIKIRAQAESEADRLRNQAFKADPEFYTFLRKLEEYGKILGDNKTTLFLSTKRDLFDLLLNPPSPGRLANPAASVGPGSLSNSPSRPIETRPMELSPNPMPMERRP